MNKLTAFFVLFLLTTSYITSQNKNTKTASKTTVYYLIRHAEKDRSDPTDQDPELTEKGIQRAKKWAEIFKDIPIDQIYSTDYKRTLQTAGFTAKDKALEIIIYNPKKLYNRRFQNSTKGKTVLIVGHSNTTPAFVNAIVGKSEYQDMKDSDNGKLFIVTIKEYSTYVETRNYN